MFSIDEINLYREEYIKYSNNIIPIIEDVMYDLKGDSNGLIKSSEIINKKIIVHLNPEIFEYHTKFQVGVLWHEFTHIYDELNCTYTSNIKQNYMKSVSEVRATSFEYKYLLNMRPYEKFLYDTSRKIHFMNYHREFEAILNYYNECSKIEFEKFLKTLLPEDFNSACNSFMYLCGAVMITYHDSSYIKKKISSYPDEFCSLLRSIVDLLYEKDEIKVCKSYELLKNIAVDMEIEQIKSQGKKF